MIQAVIKLETHAGLQRQAHVPEMQLDMSSGFAKIEKPDSPFRSGQLLHQNERIRAAEGVKPVTASAFQILIDRDHIQIGQDFPRPIRHRSDVTANN